MATESNMIPQGAPLKIRDPRLDFFRGIAMLIIFIAHVPWNYWKLFIPARFGPSDAAEMFVFCSGFAAAIAFGGTFVRKGFWLGTARILYRIYQIYIAHIMMFFLIAGTVVIATLCFGESMGDKNYVTDLGLNPFFDGDTGAQLVGLFTLTYVPNYFDILPMYIGVLCMVPVVVLCQRIHTGVAIGFVFGLYALALVFGWNFPAEPWSDRQWYFNPLGWQLLFFTGFAISRGWVRVPEPTPLLVGLALLIVVLGFLIGNTPTWTSSETLSAIREAIRPWLLNKTHHGLFRWAHFLALAYLAVVLLKGREHYLYSSLFAPIRKVGQQALSSFILSMALSRVAGVAIDYVGKENRLGVAIVNLVGLATVIGFAYFAGWVKSHPWSGKSVASALPDASEQPTRTGATASGSSGNKPAVAE